jgi:ubiquinone/menaquinone biosynthesis C-methylase UbiE
VLEIGPGTGRHAVQVAQWVAPAGTLDVFDVQQEMLDAVMRRAGDRAVKNITPKHGQAGARLPYPDARFDAAYLVTVIGEIPILMWPSASYGASCVLAGDSRSAR